MGVDCRSVAKSFPGRGAPTEAIADVTFSAADGEFLCVVGPSGCGKTTLLRIVAGLAAPTAGTVEIAVPDRNGRPPTAMVFQDHGLFPWMTVVDNVAYGLESARLQRSERRGRALSLLERFGLAGFAGHYPHELSTGMRQRVAIARALVADAPVLLCDEPFASLDAQTRWLLQGELLALWTSTRKTVLFVTHDIDEAIRMGDRIVVLSGRPARVREIVAPPAARPRENDPETAAASAQVRAHVWSLLRNDARDCLERPA
ncbi:MAG TPA: ABC transporter ATP-binding protein [Thermoanaerobaculia bacterium]|nr:ABC transporter ATP-binding protein [Thermoanaerobaculia bacterium]